MGPDGQAKDGFARPGCHCRACDVTNSMMEALGYGSQVDRQEGYSIGKPDRDYRNWERDLTRHQEEMAGVPESEMSFQ